jgi:tetratricopeptide (TPR) repeat protein
MFLAGCLLAAATVWHPAPAAGSQIPTPHTADPTRPAPRPVSPAQPPIQIAPQDDSFASLQRRLAEAMQKNDLAGAVTIAERQHRLFPNEMKATADLGDVYLARGDADRAEPLLRAAITQPSKLYTSNVAPVLGGIYANLGQISLAKGHAQDAIGQLQRAVDYAPTAARPRFLLASAFAIAGEADRSTREIRAAFDIDSTAARPGDYVLLARSLRRSGNLTAANDAVEAAVKRFPLDIDIRVERAELLRARKRSGEALCDLLYAQMLAPANDPRLAPVADAITQLRNEAEAASADDPDPELVSLLSYLDDASTGQYDEALPTIADVVAADPQSPVTRLLLGRAYLETGRMAEAERVLTELVDQDPSNVPALAELARLYFAEGRSGAASRTVARARSVAPDNPRLREIIDAWKE